MKTLGLILIGLLGVAIQADAAGANQNLTYENFEIHARRGTDSGGGGGAVHCEKENSVELFDYYEARVLWEIKIDLGAPDVYFMDKVVSVIERIALLDPVRGSHYFDRAATFMSEARFVSDIIIPEINDSNGVIFPAGCKLKQIAVQRYPVFPKDPYYIISKDLWDLMSNDSKAGLILHEIIYREARALRQEDSLRSRYFNAIISSSDMATLSVESYLDLLDRHLEFPFHFGWYDEKNKVMWRFSGDYSHQRIPGYTPPSPEEACIEEGGRLARESQLESVYEEFSKILVQYGQLEKLDAVELKNGRFKLYEDYFDEYESYPSFRSWSALCLIKAENNL